MTKKQIKRLAQESYTSNTPDEAKIATFASHMNRKTVKKYLNQLKAIEKSHNVLIALPNLKSYNIDKKTLENLFKNKKIIIQEDPSLIVGMRITDNDMVFEQSLTSSLERIVSQVKEQYT